MMARRERAEGADDEGREVGQNKVYSVGLDGLIKTWTEILISNSRQSIGGRNNMIIMQSSNNNKLKT